LASESARVVAVSGYNVIAGPPNTRLAC
jgi:hypothetical protein